MAAGVGSVSDSEEDLLPSGGPSLPAHPSHLVFILGVEVKKKLQAGPHSLLRPFLHMCGRSGP